MDVIGVVQGRYLPAPLTKAMGHGAYGTPNKAYANIAYAPVDNMHLHSITKVRCCLGLEPRAEMPNLSGRLLRLFGKEAPQTTHM